MRRMPRVKFRLWAVALLLALFAGMYAVAIAQQAPKKSAPKAAPPPPPAPAPESPLLVEPKTPSELFDAAILTDGLNRSALAKRYLEKLLQANPSDEVLLDLRTTHGPAIFIHLANNPDLRPASSELLDRVTAIFKKHGEDPLFIDTLIRGVQAPPKTVAPLSKC